MHRFFIDVVTSTNYILTTLYLLCVVGFRHNNYTMPMKKRTRVSNGLRQQRNTASKRVIREKESEEQRQSRLFQNRTAAGAVLPPAIPS